VGLERHLLLQQQLAGLVHPHRLLAVVQHRLRVMLAAAAALLAT
jgi:hypothetical protein